MPTGDSASVEPYIDNVDSYESESVWPEDDAEVARDPDVIPDVLEADELGNTDELVLDSFDIACRHIDSSSDDDPEGSDPDDTEDLDNDQLLPEEHASQMAADLVSELGCDSDLQPAIQEILLASSHWKTRTAIKTLIIAGASAAELSACLRLRMLWADSPDYWSQFGGGERSPSLPWRIAYDIVTSFHGLPDDAELEAFLIESLDDYQRSCQEKRAGSFAYYLRDRLASRSSPEATAPFVHLGQSHEWDNALYDDGERHGGEQPSEDVLRELGIPPISFRHLY